jgi:hypothetical protein
MKKIIQISIISIVVLFTSCKHSPKPNEEALIFLNQFGRDSLALLADSSLVVGKINKWQSAYKNVSIKNYKTEDMTIRKVKFSLTDKIFMELQFYFVQSKLYKMKAIPCINQEEEVVLWDSLVAKYTSKYKRVGENTFEVNGQYALAYIPADKNITNNCSSSDPKNYLQIGVDLEKAHSVFSEQINKYLSTNKGKEFYIDFRQGTIKIPEGKVWVTRKSENMVGKDMNFGEFDTSKTCQCDFKGQLESSTYLIVNGKCIHLGSLAPPYERSIISAGADLCIPNGPPVINRDNGKKEYLFYNQVIIEEFGINDIPSYAELISFIKSLGLSEGDFYFIKNLNILSSKEKLKTGLSIEI